MKKLEDPKNDLKGDLKEDGVFKVYFKGKGYEIDKNWNLTFFYHTELVESFDNFQNFLMNYNELTRKKKAYSLNNIVEVITYGQIKEMQIQNYYILLRTKKKVIKKEEKQPSSESTSNKKKFENEIREGYLIARLKSQEDYIIGYWPYEFFIHHMELHRVPILNILQTTKNPEDFENILLVS
ncbi:MAG: hypothetical protein K9W44_03110 [Candidatus Lokiarchaeota archaeon]|nr:hypothetical protein [Candidatus Harpocratesius repetitus]